MTGVRPGGSIAAVSRTALELLRLLAQDAPAEQLEEQARRPGRRTTRRPGRSRASSRCGCGPASTGTAAARPSSRRWSTRPATWRRCPTRAACSTRSCGGRAALIGADVAYLTLADAERGDTYMRATVGLGLRAVPDAAAAARAPASAGWWRRRGGRTGPPTTRATARYRHTLGDRRRGGARRASSRSAAPRCWWTGEFVGVLFAANRSSRGRSPRTRWRCSARSPRWPRCRSCRPARPRRPPTRWLRCRVAHAGIQQAAAAHDRFAGRRARRRRGGRHRRRARRAAGLLGGGPRRRRAAAGLVRRGSGRPAGRRPAGRLRGRAPLRGDRLGWPRPTGSGRWR